MVTELRGGLIINDEAMALAIKLEAAGHVLSAVDGQLIVTKASQLTAVQRIAIAKHRLHLLAIAGYPTPEVL